MDSDAGLHFAPWGADSDFFSAPNDQWMYGWGDEMSTFLTNPGQIDWVSGYNLGVDFSNSGFLYNA